MKKYLFFLSAVSIALFTACSSEEDLAEVNSGMTPEEEAAITAEANLDSEVQIRLGMGSQSSSTVTRAPLESDAVTGLFETPDGKYLGIYCLAQQQQEGVTLPSSWASESIDWSTTHSDRLWYLMSRNQAAKVVKVTGGSIGNVELGNQETVSEVQFVNGNATMIYYYPYGNWYNYYFYGYYPRQETGITEDDNRISVNYTIDGTQDIIWGKASPEDSPTTGFNAKYMRDKQKLADHDGKNKLADLPKLAMKHKLTQVRFWVKTTSSTYESYGYGTTTGKKTFRITDLKLTKVPTKWTLVIADRNNTGNDEGTLTSGTTPADLSVKFMDVYGEGNANEGEADPSTATDGSAISASGIDIPHIASTDNTTKPKLLGYLMIPTTEMMEDVSIEGRSDASVPYMDFTISYGGSVGGSSSTAQTWEFTDQKITLTSGGFEAGNVYNVILNIPTPEEIAMLATLEDWDWVSVTAGGSQNINVEVE